MTYISIIFGIAIFSPKYKLNNSIFYCFQQESMSQGTVGWWVIGLYLRSVGAFLSVTIILSLVLMQLSQNFTFLWLTYWVKNRTKNSTTLEDTEFLEHPTEKTNILDHGVLAIDNVIHTIINATRKLLENKNVENTTSQQGPPVEQLLQDLKANVTPIYTDNFYLEVYFGLAGLNLVFTIMRAFLFAYGGVKAATRIHKVLLKVIIKVSIFFSTLIL